MKEEHKRLFDRMKEQFIEDAIEVGFTKEQAEFMRKHLGSTAMGFGIGLF